MTGENSPQKGFSGQMSNYFAPDSTLAHIGPDNADPTLTERVDHLEGLLKRKKRQVATLKEAL